MNENDSHPSTYDLTNNVDICSLRESFPREEDPRSRSWTPLCYEGQYYSFVQYLLSIFPVFIKYLSSICLIFVFYAIKVSITHLSMFIPISIFPAGVEKGKHSAEEEDHRAHKDGAAGI